MTKEQKQVHLRMLSQCHVTTHYATLVEERANGRRIGHTLPPSLLSEARECRKAGMTPTGIIKHMRIGKRTYTRLMEEIEREEKEVA